MLCYLISEKVRESTRKSKFVLNFLKMEKFDLYLWCLVSEKVQKKNLDFLNFSKSDRFWFTLFGNQENERKCKKIWICFEFFENDRFWLLEYGV